jgi:hypothetical protein
MPRAHVPRTESEIQLGENENAAEWRDLCMFYRIANGIHDRQQEQKQEVLLPAAGGLQYDDDDRCYEEQYGAFPAVDENSRSRSTRIVVHHVPPTDDDCHQEQPPTNSGYLPAHVGVADHSSMAPTVDNDWSLSGYAGRQEHEIRFPILGEIRTLGRESRSSSACWPSIAQHKNLVPHEPSSEDASFSEEDGTFSMDDI